MSCFNAISTILFSDSSTTFFASRFGIRKTFYPSVTTKMYDKVKKLLTSGPLAHPRSPIWRTSIFQHQLRHSWISWRISPQRKPLFRASAAWLPKCLSNPHEGAKAFLSPRLLSIPFSMILMPDLRNTLLIKRFWNMQDGLLGVLQWKWREFDFRSGNLRFITSVYTIHNNYKIDRAC